MNSLYKTKYLKYKNKYIQLKKKQYGGNLDYSWLIKDNEQPKRVLESEFQQNLETQYNFGHAVEILFNTNTYYITLDGKYQFENKVLIRQQNILNISEDEHYLFEALRECAIQNNVILRIAGGWVRDKILKKQNDDIDITVDIMTGKSFSNILFKFINSREGGWRCSKPSIIEEDAEKSKNLETATIKIKIPDRKEFEIDLVGLRKEVYDNSDSRIPTVTQATVEEDAMRRDLTINSLFYNIITNNLEDYVGGVRDIHRKVIRTPLDPIRTFNDDPLRVLRTLRFLCRFKFSLDEMTEIAIQNEEIKEKLGRIISRPRIGKEILGFFKEESDPLLGFSKIYEKGLWNIIFGGEGDWGNISMNLLKKLGDKSIINVLAIITYPLFEKDIGKTFRLKEKTSVDTCITVDLCLKNKYQEIVSKIHDCIYKIITDLGKKDQTLWKPSDVALIIIFVEEYLNNMIEVGKTLNEELFYNIDCFINKYNLQDSYKQKNFDTSLVVKSFNLSDGRKLGVLLKILFAWKFDNPPGSFEEAIKLKDRFLQETEELARIEEALYAERQKQKKEQNKKKL